MDPLGEPVGPGEPAQRGHPVPAVPLALVDPLVQQVRFRARQDRAGRAGQSALQAQFQVPRGRRGLLVRAVLLVGPVGQEASVARVVQAEQAELAQPVQFLVLRVRAARQDLPALPEVRVEQAEQVELVLPVAPGELVALDPADLLVHPGRVVQAAPLVEPAGREELASRVPRAQLVRLVLRDRQAQADPRVPRAAQVVPVELAPLVLPVQLRDLLAPAALRDQVVPVVLPVAPEEPGELVESVPRALRPGLRVRVGHPVRQAQQAELVGPEALEALAQQARRLAHLGRPVPRDRVDLPAELEAPAVLGEQVELAEPEVSELRAQRQALLGQVVLAARLVRPGVQAEPAEQVAPARLEPPAQHRGRQVRLDHQGQAAHPVHQGLPARPAERVALAVLGARAEPAELARPARPRDDSSASRSSPPQTPASTLSTAPPEPSSSPPTGRVPAAAVSLAPRAVARGRAEARPAQSWS